MWVSQNAWLATRWQVLWGLFFIFFASSFLSRRLYEGHLVRAQSVLAEPASDSSHLQHFPLTYSTSSEDLGPAPHSFTCLASESSCRAALLKGGGEDVGSVASSPVTETETDKNQPCVGSGDLGQSPLTEGFQERTNLRMRIGCC